MKLFLTSSIGASYKADGIRIPCALDTSNNFVKHLRENWPEQPRCVIMSSEPDNEEMNDSFINIYAEAFRLTGLPFAEIAVCDRRNENHLVSMLYDYNIVMLAGGHVPTQNAFFKRIRLKELLKTYEGLVIGISAGSMNSADIVYAQPEMEGEATDPQYKRYIDGLGLISISILPHYQDIKALTVDGMRILEDISLPDSLKRPFYALNDGSYIYSERNKTVLYGEAYLFKDGIITQVSETDKYVNLL
jgi:peptidase E